MGATRRSVAFRELRVSRLEALHEMAYLRIFLEWERFLEEAFLRTLCGYVSSQYTPQFTPGRVQCGTLAGARVALYEGKDYLLWHNPGVTARRARRWFVDCPMELATLSSQARLEWLAAVRHRVAHGSTDARRKLDAATMGLAGRRYRGSSAGRFLRDWDTTGASPRRWLGSAALELVSLARQIATEPP